MEDEGFLFPSDVETIVIAASWPLRHFTELPRHKYPGIQHGAQSPTESHGIEADGDHILCCAVHTYDRTDSSSRIILHPYIYVINTHRTCNQQLPGSNHAGRPEQQMVSPQGGSQNSKKEFNTVVPSSLTPGPLQPCFQWPALVTTTTWQPIVVVPR